MNPNENNTIKLITSTLSKSVTLEVLGYTWKWCEKQKWWIVQYGRRSPYWIWPYRDIRAMMVVKFLVIFHVHRDPVTGWKWEVPPRHFILQTRPRHKS